MSSSRLDIEQEKMRVSQSSIEFVWDDDDDESCDIPALKAISMSSLGISDSSECDDLEKPLRVRFSADIDCQAYLHLMDYSLKESKDCFYTREERARMSASRDDIIDKIDRGVNEEAEDELLRGLEYWCVESSKVIDRRVDDVIALIMDEQDSQIDNNIFDEYTISVSAKKVTAESSKVARKIAREDARLAQEAYLDMAHNESIASYMMPATLCAFELTKDKKKSKRRRPSKRNSKVDDSAADAAVTTPPSGPTLSEEFTVPKKIKEEKKDNTDTTITSAKSTKKRRSSTTLLKKRKEQKERRNSDETEKSTKSCSSSKSSSKNGKKRKGKSKKANKRSSKVIAAAASVAAVVDKDTVATEPLSPQETLTTKQLSEHDGSLSSDEDDNFLSSTTSKKLSSGPPARRYTLSGPPPSIPIDELEEEEENARPMLERGYSWWNLAA